jgi:FtsH-binding integral membrane protein
MRQKQSEEKMNKKTTKVQEKKAAPVQKSAEDAFPFTKDNYKWMIIGILVSFLGFILMSGGGTDDPTQFAGDTLFSFRRMTLAPIMILAGFAVVLWSIIKTPKEG